MNTKTKILSFFTLIVFGIFFIYYLKNNEKNFDSTNFGNSEKKPNNLSIQRNTKTNSASEEYQNILDKILCSDLDTDNIETIKNDLAWLIYNSNEKHISDLFKAIQALPIGNYSKQEFYKQLIEKSCLNGFDNELLFCITKQFSSGSVRTNLLKSFFTYTNYDFDKKIEYLKTTSLYQDEKNAVISTLGYKLSPDSLDNIPWKKLRDISGDNQPALAQALALGYGIYASKSGSVDLEYLKKMASSVDLYSGNSSESENITSLILKNLATADQLAAWNYFELNEAKIPDKDKQAIEVNLADRLAVYDPAYATKHLFDKNRSSQSISTAYYKWLKSDLSAANDWYTEKKSSMNSEMRDSITMNFIRYNLENGEIDNAGLWLDQLTDMKLRQKANTKIQSLRK